MTSKPVITPAPSDVLEMAEHLPHMTWIAGANGQVEFLSQRLRELTGLKPDDLHTAGWRAAIHSDDQQAMLEVWESAVAVGEPYEIEARLRCGAPAQFRWHLLAARPAFDPDGKVRKWYGSVTDIHDRIAATEALRSSEAQLRAIYESEPECVKLVSADGVLLQMNPAGLRMIEAERPDEAIGQRIRALIHPDDADAFNDLHHAALDGRTEQAVFRIKGLRGTLRWMLSRSTPMYDDAGKAYGVLSVTHDITERWRDQELRMLEAQVFDAVSAGRPLVGILETITLAVDRLQPDARASIQLIEDGKLRHGAAPKLPESFNQEVDGLAIGEGVGSCGTAAARRSQVIVEDVEHDPLWRDHVEIARANDIAACWSLPIIGKEGEVIATFALYYDHIRRPSREEQAFIDRVGRYVRLAIERSRQNDALRLSEQRYRSIFDLVPVSIWEEDWSDLMPVLARVEAEGGPDYEAYLQAHPDLVSEAASRMRVLDVNDAAVRLFNARDKRHLIDSFAELFTGPTSHVAFRKVLATYLRGQRLFESENQLRTLSGDTIHVVVRIALPDAATGLSRALVCEMDITEHKRTEERFQAIARTTSDLLWEYDLRSHGSWLSEGAATWLGMPEGEALAIGLHWDQLIHPDDRERIMEVVTPLMQGKSEKLDEEFRLVKADGTLAHVRAQARLLRDSEGEPARTVGSIVDVTDQRQLEQQLSESQRLESIGRLTGGIAHDFNNLLTVILGNSELMVERLDDNPRLRDLAEMCGNAALRGAELTNRLLAFARRQPLAPKSTDINRLIKGLESMLRRTIGGQIEMELVHGGGLWKALIDTPQLESAILNLCINARDAMPDGGKLTIETANASLNDDYARTAHGVDPGQYVMITVSDTGCGMNAEILARVFEPFFTTKEAGKGSGLGLSMVYGFVKQSRGHVRIYSEPGHGTAVKLYLPRVTVGHESAPAPAIAGKIERGVEHILLVEDDDLVRMHVEGLLQGLGYHVTTAPDGHTALSLLEGEGVFDLLFTDVVMPGGISGRQLADHAARLRPNLPVLFTSGYTENSIVHHGRLDPGVELLQKPYRRQQLAAKLRKMLKPQQ
ncbi:MAG: PAS domain S-box protein [Pararhodobacter sp.]